MEINRHNYEHFFLLWVDNELCTKDQKMVEQFIAENPDLADELAQLMETVLPNNERVAFPNKEALLKNATDSISLSNYEMYFLLYVDGELNKADAEAVELFVLQHPALQAEFLLIQQTKLPQEVCVFENKAVLYRNEKIAKPVIVMQWKRMAIAAALIGLAFSIWMIVPGTKHVDQASFASLGKPSKASGNNASVSANNMPVNKTNARDAMASIAANSGSRATSTIIGTTKALENNSISNTNEAIRDEVVANTNNTTNTIVAAINNEQPEIISNHATGVNAITEKNSIAVNTDAETDHTDIIRPAVYKELDTEENTKTVYIGSLEINKDKLRGFFRKAGSLLKSKSKEEEKIDTNK